MILREKYLTRIIPFIDKPLIKVITGIRRCGKSVFMRQIAQIIKDKGVSENNIITINKELLEFDFIKDYADLHAFVTKITKSSAEKFYLFIDEVQEIKEWERAVNSFLAEEKYDIYISGSNAKLLSSDLTSLISGRYIEIRLFTLTYSEFKELFYQKKDVDSNIDVFAEFLKYGGFPGLHNLVWEEHVLRQYLESIYSTVVLKDVVLRNNIKNVAMLDKIIVFIASNCGNITSAKSITDFTKSQGNKISVDTVLNYIQYAIEAQLIHKIKRYDILGKTVLETYEKYFLADIGLSLNTVGNTPDLLSGKLENIVLLELLSRGYHLDTGKNKAKEVDFIARKNNEKMYIQVCVSLSNEEIIKREYGAFTGIKDSFPKIVLSLDEAGFTTDKNGIQWMNIKDFLLKRNRVV